MVLRVSSSWAPVPAIARTPRAAAVATPERRPRKFSAVRSPVSSARARPSTREDRAALVAPDALVDLALEPRVGVEGPERRLGGVEAEDHPRRLLDDAGDGAGVGVDRGLGGDVARAHVLGEGLVHELLEAHSCRT